MPTLTENSFTHFADKVIGNDLVIENSFGPKKLIYADWIASGRLYKPIEDKLTTVFGPFVGNTHTETTESGARMTNAYQWSHAFIKKQVNAGKDDVIITSGSGMTDVVNKFQRILGLKYCGKVAHNKC